MRIAFHAPRASHLRAGASGDRIFVGALLSALRERGHEVEIVSRVNVRDYWRGRIPARRLIGEAVSVHRRMRRFAPDAWLIYGPSARTPDLFGWWQRPKRYVLFAADGGTGKRLPRRWRWLFVRAHRRSLRRADKAVAYRPASADDLRSLGVPARRVAVLPLAIRLWDELPSREAARARLQLPQSASVALCASRLTPMRQDGKLGKTEAVLALLDALATARASVVLALVGEGPGRGDVERRVAELDLGEQVRLVGLVEHAEMRWYYAASDFLAYASFVDRPWLTVLEAQASGRPVVTMRTRSAELTVDAGRTGLLAADLDEFRAHVLLLATDRDLCRSLGEAARSYAARCHSLETRIRQIETLLRPGEIPPHEKVVSSYGEGSIG